MATGIIADSWLKKIVAGLLIICGSSLLFIASFMAAGALPVQDLAQYWSAAHLVRLNPYSYQLVAHFQHSNGIFVDPPLVLKNPPWAIPFILPLGVFSYRAAFAAWTLFTISVLMIGTRAVWLELNAPASSLVPLLFPFLFGPAIVQLLLGQCTILVLLGIVAFLIAAEKGRDWTAGAALVLVLGKPHVALLFLLVAALWIVRQRRWRILASGCLALIATSLFVEFLNPHIWSQFVARMTLVAHEGEAYPNLGGMLYLVSRIHSLALIPQLLGFAWVAFYWRKHRNNWNWWEQGTMVLLCSVFCSYYSYPYDEILALPALLFAIAHTSGRAFWTAFLITELGYVVYVSNGAGYFGFGYMFLSWTASGWLVACILAQRSRLYGADRHEPLRSDVN